MKIYKLLWTFLGVACVATGCASAPSKDVPPDKELKLDRELVRNAVIYDPGTKNGAVVPEVSAPRLHAIYVPETRNGNRIDEAHRAWVLEGDVTILGIPSKGSGVKKP